MGRCGASEHACVTLSKFRLMRETMSLSGQMFVNQIGSKESSAGIPSGGGEVSAAECGVFVALIPSIAKAEELLSLIIKRTIQSMTGECGTV